MTLQTNVMSYGGSGVTISVAPASHGQASPAGATSRAKKACACTSKPATGASTLATKGKPRCACDNGQPDFSMMTAAQKVAHQLERWNKIFG